MPPVDTDDSVRIKEAHRREAILSGDWTEILRKAINGAFGDARGDVIKLPSRSWNLGRHVVTTLSVLYAEGAPSITGGEKLPAELVGDHGILAESGVWAAGPRFQRSVNAHHMAARLLHMDNDGVLSTSIVHPGMMSGEARPATPTTPVVLKVWQWRQSLSDGAWRWVRMCWDIRDPGAPTAWMEDQEGDDLSAEYMPGGARAGKEYIARWSYEDGRPFIPAVLTYREAGGSELFPEEGGELWEATIEIATYVSHVGHCFRNAAFKRLYGIGVELLSGGLVDAETGDAEQHGLHTGGDRQTASVLRRRVALGDPTEFLQFGLLSDEISNPSVGALAMSADPGELLTVVERLAQGAATREGIAPGSLKRTAGGGIASGYAIELSREDQRQAQKRFAPSFAPSDAELVGKASAMHNRIKGTSWPESGFTVDYPAVRLSAAEEQALRDQLSWELEQGFCTPIEALARLRQISEDRARAVYAQNQAEKVSAAIRGTP